MRRLRLSAVLLSLFLLLGLAGCGSAKQSPVTVRIGVALYQQDDTFISTVVQSLEQQAKEEEQVQGIKLNLTLSLIHI